MSTKKTSKEKNYKKPKPITLLFYQKNISDKISLLTFGFQQT